METTNIDENEIRFDNEMNSTKMADRIAQEMEALEGIQKRLEDLIQDLGAISCPEIKCDECPVKRFCDTFLYKSIKVES